MKHNEIDSLTKQIEFLVEHKDIEDEIVILDDFSDNEETKRILDATVSIYDIKFEQRHLMRDFAVQKNHLKDMCTGNYIFNLETSTQLSSFFGNELLWGRKSSINNLESHLKYWNDLDNFKEILGYIRGEKFTLVALPGKCLKDIF